MGQTPDRNGRVGPDGGKTAKRFWGKWKMEWKWQAKKVPDRKRLKWLI